MLCGMDKGDAILLTDGNDTSSTSRKNVFASMRGRFLDAFSRRHFMDTWRDVPMEFRFRCTNRCNENCARCFECSGPNNPLNVLPVSDIAFYQNAAGGLKSVYMTGGEWSLIYDVDAGYMLRAFNSMNLRNADFYAIQTNCRWVFGPNCDKIYSDLCMIQDKLATVGKQLKLDVSVDSFRSRAALDGVRELICRIGADNKFQNTKIRIMSSRLDYQMANDVILRPEYFEPRGVKLRFEPRDFFNPFFQAFYANNKRMIIHEENPTMRIGRAAENKIGYMIFSPEQQCGGLAGRDKLMELSFREDGTVKWHSYYDWDIVIPYKDAAGQNKTIDRIKQELLQAAWRRHLKHSLTETAWSMVPIVGLARAVARHRRIQESFQQNQAKIMWRAREL